MWRIQYKALKKGSVVKMLILYWDIIQLLHATLHKIYCVVYSLKHHHAVVWLANIAIRISHLGSTLIGSLFTVCSAAVCTSVEGIT